MVLTANALLATAMLKNKSKLSMAALVTLAIVDPTANVVSARKSPSKLPDANVVIPALVLTANVA